MKHITVAILFTIALVCEAPVSAQPLKGTKMQKADSADGTYGVAKKLDPKKSVAFADFVLRYEGEESKDGGPNGPTVEVTTRSFVVTDLQNKSQTLKVVSVQNPPKPVEFVIGSNKFILYTFELPSGQRLFPDHFAVVKK